MSELLLPQLTQDLTPLQKGWIGLSQTKAEYVAELSKNELQIQSVLSGYEKLELAPLQEKLTEAKSLLKDGKDCRLKFTNMLDEKIIKPMMEPEKRNALLVDAASKKELELRIAASKANQEANDLIKEKQYLTAHIKNEFYRIATSFKNALQKELFNIYSEALNAKIDPNQIAAYIEISVPRLSAIPLESAVKFNRVLVTEDMAKEILSTIDRYTTSEDLQSAVKKLREETFAMYANDFQNAAAAIAAATEKSNADIESNNRAAILETSTNVLVSQATDFELISGVKVKEKRAIVVENTEDYFLAVMSAFLKNFPDAKSKLSVRTWSKLADPFTKALEKLDTEFPGIKYETIQK